MPTELRLIEIADGMTSAKIVTWFKRTGDVVAAGEPLAEIETDKVSVELEAPTSGVLHQIHVAAGTSVPVGALLAVILEQEGAAQSTSRTTEIQPTPIASETVPMSPATAE